MKPRKSTVIVVLLAFLLAAFAIAMGHGTTGGTQDPKKAESGPSPNPASTAARAC